MSGYLYLVFSLASIFSLFNVVHGDSFNSNREVPAATLDVINTCSVDNWGMPHQKRPPYSTTYKSAIQNACKHSLHKDQMRPMAHVLENATVNHYLNNKDFDDFVGIDLVPDNHKLYKTGGLWGRNLEYKHVRRDYMKAANCETEQPDGSTWTVTRIGPMRTKGGYDWIQVGWDNLWDIRGKLKEHPHGIYVLEQFSGAVTADGTRLGHPPIHIHHIHVGPEPGVRQRTDSVACVFQGKHCYDPTRIFEHHGDYQCTGVPDGPQSATSGGLDCLNELVPDGYGKLLTFPIGLEGDINDVRAPNSTVLEWYYELSARWIPKLECSDMPVANNDDTDTTNGASTTSTVADKDLDTSVSVATKNSHQPTVPSAFYPRPKALSFHNFNGPGDLNTKQSSLVFTYQSPTDRESIFWYSGRMHHSGKLLRLKQHAHNIIFKESIVFAASPEQLGLTKANKLVPALPYQVVETKKAGFENNVELKKFILETLKQSQQHYQDDNIRRHLRYTNRTLTSSSGSIGMNKLSKQPRAICQAIESSELVDGYYYDRREPTCCVPWSFTEGEIFTIVGFNKIVTETSAGVYQSIPSIPKTFPGHIGWWLSYDTQEVPEQSRYSLVQYTNNPDIQFQDFGAMHEDRLMFVLNGGTAYDPNTWTYLIFKILVYIYHHPIVLPLCVVCVILLWRILNYLFMVFVFVLSNGAEEPLKPAQD